MSQALGTLTYLIIGTSAAAIGALAKLRQLVPEARIVCVSDEPELPYNKCLIVDHLAGILEEAGVYTRPASFFADNRIELKLGMRVTAIDPLARQVIMYRVDDPTHIEQLTYEVLLLAIGRKPVVPYFGQSAGCSNLFPFYTLAHAQTLMTFLADNQPQQAVVVGAGLTGLECADALLKRGVQVAVVEAAPRVLARCGDERVARFVTDRLQASGGQLLTGVRIAGVREHAGRVTTVMLEDGRELAADVLVTALGARPHADLLAQAGVELYEGSVVVDATMRTSDSHIFAAGDVTSVTSAYDDARVHTSTWPDAMLQGLHAAHGMAGAAYKPYAGAYSVVDSHFFSCDVKGMGMLIPASSAVQVHERRGDDFYHQILLENGVLKGFMLIGRIEQYPELRRLVLARQAIDPTTL